MRKTGLVLALAGLCMGSNAWGEAAEMRGKFPANVRAANQLEAIVVDRFYGSDGGQVRALIEGMIGIPQGRPDGALSGTVTTGVEQNKYQGTERQCVEWKDGKQGGQCLKNADVAVPCWRRIINLNLSVRLTRLPDNQTLWSDIKSSRDETTWCANKSPNRTTEEAVTALLRTAAERIRYDVRPVYSTYKVRFREDRDGMPKDLGGEFKEIVKASKRDVGGACRQWAALDPRLPNNASVRYNLGVCAEANGAYREAQDYYRSAQAALSRRSGDIDESIDRVARLMIARADDEEMARRRGR